MATVEDMHHLEKQNTDHDQGEVSAEKTQQERAWSICQVHGKDLMPLLCQDCESAVCLDCLVKTHVGHKMSNISECVEEKVEKLNDAILRKESPCYRKDNGILRIRRTCLYNKSETERKKL